jgi:hypothetical protein
MKETTTKEYWLTRDSDGTRTLWTLKNTPVYDKDLRGTGFWDSAPALIPDNMWSTDIVGCDIVGCDEKDCDYPSVTEILGTKKCYGVRKGGIKKIKVKTETTITTEIEIL